MPFWEAESEVHTTVHLKAISNRECLRPRSKQFLVKNITRPDTFHVKLLLYTSSYFNNVWLLLEIRQTEKFLQIYPASLLWNSSVQCAQWVVAKKPKGTFQAHHGGSGTSGE